MKKFVSILLLLTNLIVSNANSIEADVFVQSTVNRASEILSKIFQEKKKLIVLK
jgi:phospholipid transport system substrate-binding protein